MNLGSDDTGVHGGRSLVACIVRVESWYNAIDATTVRQLPQDQTSPNEISWRQRSDDDDGSSGCQLSFDSLRGSREGLPTAVTIELRRRPLDVSLVVVLMCLPPTRCKRRLHTQQLVPVHLSVIDTNVLCFAVPFCVLAVIVQDDEDRASWDPKGAIKAGDYQEDGSAVLGVATLQMAEVLGLDAAVRNHQFFIFSHLRHTLLLLHHIRAISWARKKHRIAIIVLTDPSCSCARLSGTFNA